MTSCKEILEVCLLYAFPALIDYINNEELSKKATLLEVITECDRYYKVWLRLLQSATVQMPIEDFVFLSQGRGAGDECKLIDAGIIEAPWYGVCLVPRGVLIILFGGACRSMSTATHVTLKMVSQTKQTEGTPYLRPKWQNLYPISD